MKRSKLENVPSREGGDAGGTPWVQTCFRVGDNSQLRRYTGIATSVRLSVSYLAGSRGQVGFHGFGLAFLRQTRPRCLPIPTVEIITKI